LYWYIGIIDKDADITYMNYGYSFNNQKIQLNEKDEKDRYSAQLYDHMVSKIPISGKSILEVGSGRGGGLYFITRYHKPLKATGVELDEQAVRFCNTNYNLKNLEYLKGDAQDLPIANGAYDFVLNVESSHRYRSMKKFTEEVHRVLKVGGYLLITDFRFSTKLEEFHQAFDPELFELISKEIINPQVLEALDNSAMRRHEQIKKIAPKIFHNIANQFAATQGTPTYNRFLNREFIYFTAIFQKK
jgi:ubiquinone/menaquinone biosynthesis C-methylase UbiE